MLKINGEALLEISDDGMFINLMRTYFSTIGDSAHPNHPDPRVRAITNFQELLVVAFREFNVITDETIQGERKRLRAIISDEIEKFAKRAAVRNLKSVGRFDKDALGVVYDHYFTAVCVADEALASGRRRASSKAGTPGSAPGSGFGTPPDGSASTTTTTTAAEQEGLARRSRMGDQFDQPRIQVDAQGRVETRIDHYTFRVFLSEIATWAREETVTTNAFMQRTEKRIADHELIDRYVRYLPSYARQPGVWA